MVPGNLMFTPKLLVHIESPHLRVQTLLQLLPGLKVPYQGSRSVIIVKSDERRVMVSESENLSGV